MSDVNPYLNTYGTIYTTDHTSSYNTIPIESPYIGESHVTISDPRSVQIDELNKKVEELKETVEMQQKAIDSLLKMQADLYSLLSSHEPKALDEGYI